MRIQTHPLGVEINFKEGVTASCGAFFQQATIDKMDNPSCQFDTSDSIAVIVTLGSQSTIRLNESLLI